MTDIDPVVAEALPEIRETIERAWPLLEETVGGPVRDPETLRSVAALGLINRLWRSSGTIEGAHSSGRGPYDGEMMMEAVTLYRVATGILASDEEFPFLAFEDYLLDLDRLWAGSSRTVRDMLHGHIRDYRQRVKRQVNFIDALEDATDRDTVLRWLAAGGGFGSWYYHFGTPNWPRVASSVVWHLSHPDDPCWHGNYATNTDEIPGGLLERPDLETTLRDAPDQLGAEVLDSLLIAFMKGRGSLGGRPSCGWRPDN